MQALRKLFSMCGLPDTLITDNRTAFTSGEFQDFTTNYRIRHIWSVPFHPTTNGGVSTAKDSLWQIVEED